MKFLSIEDFYFSTNDISTLIIRIIQVKKYPNPFFNKINEKSNFIFKRNKQMLKSNKYNQKKIHRRNSEFTINFSLKYFIQPKDIEKEKIIIYFKIFEFLLLIFFIVVRNFFFNRFIPFFPLPKNKKPFIRKKKTGKIFNKFFKIKTEYKIKNYFNFPQKFFLKFNPEGSLGCIKIKSPVKRTNKNPIKIFPCKFILILSFFQKSRCFSGKKSKKKNFEEFYLFYLKKTIKKFLKTKLKYLNMVKKMNIKNIPKLFQMDSKLKYYFYFCLWKNKWNLEFLLFIELLKKKEFFFQKIRFLNKNLVFKTNNSKNGLSYVDKKNLFFIMIKFKILVQQHPYSLALKTRLLCKNLLYNRNQKNISLGLWINDIKTPDHFNLLSFLILFYDLVFSGPKIKNTSCLTSYLSKKRIFIINNLSKAPQNLEKFLPLKSGMDTNLSKIFSLFIVKNGLIDFSRKFIFKLMFYSKKNKQKIFFKSWIQIETLISNIIEKNFIWDKEFKENTLVNNKIFNVLYKNGRWLHIYKIFCESLQDSKNWNFIKSVHCKNFIV